MNRRRFFTSFSAAIAASTLPGDLFAQKKSNVVHLAIDANHSGPTIPLDFTGLSYETAQLANPAFFSAQNKSLIALFRDLSPRGVLRLGGGSSEFTTFNPHDSTGKPPFEVFGPDTSKTVKQGTLNTPRALRNLRSFLDATGWRCLYGLNLGQGTDDNAAAEADAVQDILGHRLIAFQIGNEPDSFRNRYRPASYSPADYLEEWNGFRTAILAKVPEAKFAGPDISNKLPYFTAFAAEAPQHPDVILLTSHYYAMGPASSPKSTLEKLLDPNPKLASDLTTIMSAAHTAHLPYRMSEGNSCWDGGKPDVSDTLASALWCADMMLQFAQAGACGVNLHGGGNGFYTPIAGSPSAGFTKRPEYYGIQFAQQLAGNTFLRTTLSGASPRLTAYAFRNSHHRLLVVINKSDDAATLVLPLHTVAESKAILLTGPSFDSKATPAFHSVTVRGGNRLEIPARSATLFTLRRCWLTSPDEKYLFTDKKVLSFHLE